VLGVKLAPGKGGVEVCRSISDCSELFVRADGAPGCWLHAVIETSKTNKVQQLPMGLIFIWVTIPGLIEFFKLKQIHYNKLMVDLRGPHGVIAAAVTPLNQDGSLALDDWFVLLDFLRRRGCHGVLLLGTTGEGPSFSPSERLEVMRAIQSFRSKNPDFFILVGTGTPSLEETIFLNQAVFELGLDGVVVLPPYYYRKSGEDGLLEWYNQVIQKSVPEGCNIFIYHIPSMTGIQLSLDLISKLLDTFPDRHIGIKDSTIDPDFARALGERFGKDLLTFSGTDTLFDIALDHSASGCITAMANLRSLDLRCVWDARQHGHMDNAAQLRLEHSREVMRRYPPNPSLYKALLNRLHGFPNWALRLPLLPMPEEQLEKAVSEGLAEVEGFEE
jgi:4-hydroxy-tetrahydrodipicolinate synthase